MKLFPEFQQRIGRFFLKRKLRQQQRASGQHKKTGLIFDARDKTVIPVIQAYISKLKKKGISFSAIGYIGNNVKPADPNITYLNADDLNWYYHPFAQNAENFVVQNFDILICFYSEKNLIFEYLSCCTAAQLKIGPQIRDVDCYDVVINSPEINQFLKTLDYLEQRLKKKPTYEPKILETV